MTDAMNRLLDAALANVAFDGWSDATLKRAAAKTEMPLAEARALFPRGGVDLAMAWHRREDARLAARLADTDLSGMRYRDRVARAIWMRLEDADKNAVRRGTTLFALPMHTAVGARALWETADTIWTALGDTSSDGNWYSKRATLAGVHGAAVLFWLGDDSRDHEDTRAFIDRRIDDVMRIESAKSALAANPAGRAVLAGPNFVLSRMRPPKGLAGFPGLRRGR